MARAEELPGLGGAIDGMTRTFAVGFANLLAGRHESAGPSLEQCLASAQAVRAGPMTQVAHALLGEFHARRGEANEAARVLAEAGSPEPDGLAAAFVLRTRALLGVHGAAAELQAAAERLAAPGLMARLT